jgi:capsular exopolysaccharide synthesis family protein
VPNASDEPNIVKVLRFLRRRGIWIVLCFGLAAAAAFAYSKVQPKKYTATDSVVFSSDQLSPAIAGLPALSAEGNALLRQSNNLEQLYLGGVANKTAKKVREGLDGRQVSEMIEIGGKPESSVATISATSGSPQQAAAVANIYAAQAVRVDERANREYFNSALAIVKRQLSRLNRAQRLGPAALTLRTREQSLELLTALQPSSVRVAERAFVPTSPSSPKTARNTLIGALLGLVIGLALALALERLDPRIEDSEGLRSIYRRTLLGSVSKSACLDRFVRSRGAQPTCLSPADIETFQLIRARLRSYNAEHELNSVLVTSAGPSEGKTTVALNLAAAASRVGSRVLTIDANLRRSEFTDSVAEPGLSLISVLKHQCQLSEAVRPMWPDSVSADGRAVSSPDVLVSAPISSSSPAGELESPEMSALLRDARSIYDLIVIDAPELTVVSDAFPLLLQVDAVVVVAYVGKARRDEAESLREVLEGSGAPVAGVIANGTRTASRGVVTAYSVAHQVPAPEQTTTVRSNIAV